MGIPKVRQTKILNKSCVLEVIVCRLKQTYPDAPNAYEAAKLHLAALKELLCKYDERGTDYDLTATEILFFEWLVNETEEKFLKDFSVTLN